MLLWITILMAMSRDIDSFKEPLSASISRTAMKIFAIPDERHHAPHNMQQLAKNAIMSSVSSMSGIFLLGGAVLASDSIRSSTLISADDAKDLISSSDSKASIETSSKAIITDYGAFKLPYNHNNLEFKQFIGEKATILFNMKLDDPQTVTNFPILAEIFQKYKNQGLNVHAFPSEQGWFEPDDDETCRAKAIEYFKFGNEFPRSVVFDKVKSLVVHLL